MSMTNMFLLVSVLFFFMFVRNVLTLFFRMENDSIHKKRMKELNFNGSRIGQSQDEETKEFLNKFTEPVIKFVLPRLKYSDSQKLEDDLKFSGWSKWMGAAQYRAINIILKAVGVVAFLLLMKVQIMFAFVWFMVLFFGMGFFFNNTIANKKEAMFGDFPEFIRLTQGYLTAEVPLTEAIENTIEYVSDEWKPYLKRFSVNARIKSVGDALSILQEEIDIFEVRELLSLIRVSLDQGIDVKDSFESQTEKVRGMQLDAMMKKIEKRKMMAIALQAPLLLTIIVAFGLPTLEAMTNMGGM